MFEVKHVRLVEYTDVYMTVLYYGHKPRKYYLTVNGEESKEYKYRLWYLQKVPVLYKISKVVNTALAMLRIKRMGGR